MTIRELFEFIVDASITDDAVDSYLEEVFGICFIIVYTFLNNFKEILMVFKIFLGATKNFGERCVC